MERGLQLTDKRVSNMLKEMCAIMVALGHALPYEMYIFIPGAYFVGVFGIWCYEKLYKQS